MGKRGPKSKLEDDIRQKELDVFFKCLSEWPNVVQACKTSGINRATIRYYRITFPEFEQRFQDAWEMGIDALEANTFDKAKENPTLAIFMLKSNRRKIYGDKVESTSTVTYSPLCININRGEIAVQPDTHVVEIPSEQCLLPDSDGASWKQ